MKLLRLTLAILAMTLLLASCGGGGSSQPANDLNEEEPAAQPGEGKFPIDDETDIASVSYRLPT